MMGGSRQDTVLYLHYTLTIDTKVKVLGLFPSCIRGTTLVAGLISKTGTFYSQNLTPVCDLQIGIAEKHRPRKD